MPPSSSRRATPDPTAPLRERVLNRHILRGFGPFAVAVVLVILMVIFVPSVAPERETVVVDPSPTPASTVP